MKSLYPFQFALMSDPAYTNFMNMLQKHGVLMSSFGAEACLAYWRISNDGYELLYKFVKFLCTPVRPDRSAKFHELVECCREKLAGYIRANVIREEFLDKIKCMVEHSPAKASIRIVKK
jgi:hypothetical protein